MFLLLTLVIFATLSGVAYSYLAIRFSGLEEESTVKIGMGTMTIRYEDNSGYLSLSKVIPGASVTKEFSLYGINDTKANSNVTDNNMYYEINLMIDKNEFSDGSITYLLEALDDDNNGETVIKTGGFVEDDTIIYLGKGYFETTSTGATHTYRLTISFIENDKDQSDDMNKEIGLHIHVGGSNSLQSGNAADYITSLYDPNGNKYTSELIMDDTVDHNLRYVSALVDENDESTRKEPNNYVLFNDELWRIIGVFNGYGTSEYHYTNTRVRYLKIVKDTPLERQSFYDIYRDGKNWDDSYLYHYLLEYYLDNWENISDYSVNNIIWYPSSTGEVTDSVRLNKFYSYEKYGGLDFDGYQVLDFVGLPNVSDLIYITSYYKISTDSFNDLSAGINNDNNWLLKNSSECIFEDDCVVFTLSSVEDYAKWIWFKFDSYDPDFDYSEGIIFIDYSDLMSFLGDVYPTLYLDYDVKIVGGTGTSDDPYQLGL